MQGPLIQDPLGFDVPLPLAASFYPLGFPLTVETNAPEVLTLAASLWSKWKPRAGARPAHLRIAVSDTAATVPVIPGMPRGQRHLISAIHSPENFAICDVRNSFAWACVTRDIALDTEYFRYHFLDMLAYLMIDSAHLAPVHGACVAWRDRAMLLCGDSGAGKTSLAYTCARLGWTYLSDDATHVVRGDNTPSVAGRPYFIRFRESARALFPELANFVPKRRPNGKLDIEVETSRLDLAVAEERPLGHIVFLNRSDVPDARIEDYPASRALTHFETLVCYGDETVRREQAKTFRSLLRLPVQRLTYRDLAAAESALRELAES